MSKKSPERIFEGVQNVFVFVTMHVFVFLLVRSCSLITMIKLVHKQSCEMSGIWEIYICKYFGYLG